MNFLRVLQKISTTASAADDVLAQLFPQPRTRFLVVTVNPEMILALRSDAALRSAVMEADICLPDGMGVVWAAKMFRVPIKKRISGIDFAERLFTEAMPGFSRIFLLGGRRGVAEAAARNLARRFPRFSFEGFSDIRVDHRGDPLLRHEEDAVLQKISRFEPHMVLAGLGVPKQEKWLRRLFASNREETSSVRVGMGIGGALDIWAGRVPRAPKIMRARGLEWLWRLFIEPKRAPRVFRATFLFSLATVREYLMQR